MKLASLPVTELIAAFRSTNPTPGGGSAAALAGAMGAALLAMVAAMPKNRAGSEEDVDRLAAAAERCGALSEALVDLVDRDSAAYEAVMAAYRLPKVTESEKAERRTGIQLAIEGAAEAPLETMRRAAEALDTAAVVARFGNVNAASDVEVALELLTAAQRGARANVEINLSSIEETAYAARMRAEVARLAQECEAAAAAARQAAAQQG